MSLLHHTNNSMALLCQECQSTLANSDLLILAEAPPSQIHLAVDFRNQDSELYAYGKLNKVQNTDPKSTKCPYKLLCRQCHLHVGKVTVVAKKHLICYNTKNVVFKSGDKEVKARHLKSIKDELIRCGLPVVNMSQPTCQASKKDLIPMVYGDASGLSSDEICSLTRDTPRDYQRELFCDTMRGNSLVYLPTGSGKTLVAAMVMSCMSKLNPGKLMVFVVDKVPLAYQQFDYLKHQVPGLNMKVLTGEVENSGNSKKTVQELARGQVDVLVLTHQILLNLLADGSAVVSMSDISVLVFDEAHHCGRNHPYNQIMRDFYKHTPDKYKPLVLALTASPTDADTKEKSIARLEQLLSNLCVSSLLRPDQCLERGLNWNCPEMSDRIVALTTKQVILRSSYIEVYVRKLVPLIEKEAECSGAFQGLDIFSTNFRGALWKILDRRQGDKHKKARALGEHAVHVLSAVEINSILGYEFALQILNDCFLRLESASTPMEKVKRSLVEGLESYRSLKDFVRNEHKNAEDFPRPTSGRFHYLEREIETFISQVQEDKTSRGIVFVKMRSTAYRVCEQLKKMPSVTDNLNPNYFVGHGQGSDGMEWRGEQEEILKKFRSGEIKLLISTSVLEEGLDVPVCNLVIRFDSAMTLRSLVQSRGRASRRPDSKFVVICSEEEKGDLRNAKCKEENMEEAVNIVCQRNADPHPQAHLFECELKKPDLASSDIPELLRGDCHGVTGANDEGPPTERHCEMDRYTPRIKVTVHNVATTEDQNKIIRFLDEHFELQSLTPTDGNNLTNGFRKMHFDLEPSADHKEFRSKEAFHDLITETWCTRLNLPEAEPHRFWLQRAKPRRGTRSKTPAVLLSAECLSIGYFLHHTHFCRQWPETNNLRRVTVSFEHDLRMLTIAFTAPSEEHAERCPIFKVEMRYSELDDFILVDRGNSTNPVDLFISLRHPPRLFKSFPFDNDLQGDGYESEDSAFEDSGSESNEESDTEDEYTTDEEFPDVGQNSGYHHPRTRNKFKTLDTSSVKWERVSEISNSSGDWGECLVYHLVIPPGAWAEINSLLTSLSRFDKKAYFAAVKVSQRRLPIVPIPEELPFDVTYALKCLFTSHAVVRGRITGGRFTTLLQSRPPKAAVAAIEKLAGVLERDKFCEPESRLESILSQTNLRPSGVPSQLLPSHCALIKRLVITPTRTLFHTPEVMSKNRVLRKYDTSKFLCVNIRDEDFSKLSAAGGRIDHVLQRLKGILDNGVQVSGHRFLYLGSSNSQLRSHSCWFVEPSPRTQPDEIRRWMGDFSRIK